MFGIVSLHFGEKHNELALLNPLVDLFVPVIYGVYQNTRQIFSYLCHSHKDVLGNNNNNGAEESIYDITISVIEFPYQCGEIPLLSEEMR